MMEDVVKQLQREFATARHALREGNDGMARVCARRAAGAAISHWVREGDEKNWGVDALSQLRRLAHEPMIPTEVHAAAARLAARVNPQLHSESIDPLNDCRIIIRQFLGGEIADRL